MLSEDYSKINLYIESEEENEEEVEIEIFIIPDEPFPINPDWEIIIPIQPYETLSNGDELTGLGENQTLLGDSSDYLLEEFSPSQNDFLQSPIFNIENNTMEENFSILQKDYFIESSLSSLDTIDNPLEIIDNSLSENIYLSGLNLDNF